MKKTSKRLNFLPLLLSIIFALGIFIGTKANISAAGTEDNTLTFAVMFQGPNVIKNKPEVPDKIYCTNPIYENINDSNDTKRVFDYQPIANFEKKI